MYAPKEAAAAGAGGFDLGYWYAKKGDVEVWPENWTAVQVFCQVGTQWRTGVAGPVGLDYNVLFRLLDRLGLSQEEWDDTFEMIQALEVQAVKTMTEK